jgi:serine/threonine protein kinase
MGSQKYMAPEQRESAKHVDASADVYSVGVMAYRMITGRLPGMPFREPNVLVTELNQTANDLIVQCLADDKNQREVDAGALLKKFGQANQPLMDEDYSGTWVGGSGESTIRDELKPLRDDIREALEDHVELTDRDMAGFTMAAAVLDLSDSELPELIALVESELGQSLKLKRNFFKSIGSEAC